ncbi:hypothetical protein [Streptomyces sp. NPDC046862]|uniref:hypothetical protein n=1 Tax=Streptomyces sp. NPDC046862 TaxID=3154603 RepID=UPI0034520802
MNEPGRAMPSRRSRTRHPGTRHPHAPQRLTRAVRYAGRSLCWSLATGMGAAACELILSPQARAWAVIWILPWCLTGVSALAWAVLRALEKAARQPPEDEEHRGEWEQAA